MDLDGVALVVGAGTSHSTMMHCLCLYDCFSWKWPVQLRLMKGSLIVSWTGSGIGREVALTLASRGAHAIICADINLEAAKQTAEKSQSYKAGNISDYKVHALHVDVRDENSVGQMVDEAKSLFGRIDYFVNTAGVS